MGRKNKVAADNEASQYDPAPSKLESPFATSDVVSSVCLYGAVVGDIFGSSRKGMSPAPGVDYRVEDMLQNAWYTDNTLMNLAVANSLRDIGKDPSQYSEEQLVNIFSDGYKDAIRSHPNLQYGKKLMEWAQSDLVTTDANNFGNGAIVRGPLIGAFYADEGDEAVNLVASASAKPTHPHVTAIRATRVAATMAYYAARGVSKNDIVRFGSFFYNLDNLNPDRPKIVRKYITAECTMNDILSGNYQTVDQSADTAMSLAIIAIRENETYESCLRSILQYKGDTNTIMSIAGGIFALIEAARGVNTTIQGHPIAEVYNAFCNGKI